MPESIPTLARLLQGLPEEIKKKVNKTKQTRGAQPYGRVVYQNRVNRCGIAVVPYAFRNRLHPEGFENGYIILVRPEEYFVESGQVRPDFDPEINIGGNAFVYYDNRQNYERFPPVQDWNARSRGGPGEVVYRLPATTASTEEGQARIEGEPQGIRFFEYASSEQIRKMCIQLAMLAWCTEGIEQVRTEGSGREVPATLLREADRLELWDTARLEELGVLCESQTVCPLCKEPIRTSELMSRIQQAEGREVFDLTVTEVNLFHMKDLRPGEYNHCIYSLGWGHHHCNAVARDAGVPNTLNWMARVLRKNGYIVNQTTSVGDRQEAVEESDLEGMES